MPAYYKIDKERRLVLSTFSGVVTMADGLGHQDKLLQDPDFDPSFSQLIDYRHVTKIKLGPEDLRILAQRSIFSPESRRAMLVKSDAAFGLARKFEALRESFGEKGIRVFRDLEDALDWILAKKTSH